MDSRMFTIDDVLEAVKSEWVRAQVKHPGPINSTHEAYGVIYEEFNIEFAAAMHADDLEGAKRELIHVAAMACRAYLDVKRPCG